MSFPPSPESPATYIVGQRNSFQPEHHKCIQNVSSLGTLRVGMVIPHNDDDDISVLTFHTIGTKDTVLATPTEINGDSCKYNSHNWQDKQRKSVVSSSTFFNEKHKNQNEVMSIGKALSHISEEGASINSSSSVACGDERTNHVSCNQKECTRTDDDNDDMSSLAESVLDSTNKLLHSISSSLSHQKRSKKDSFGLSHEKDHPLAPLDISHNSQVKLSEINSYYEKSVFTKSIHSDNQDTNCFTTNICCRTNKNNQKLFESFEDENPIIEILPHDENHNYSNYDHCDNDFLKKGKNTEISTEHSDKIQKLELEVKRLQHLMSQTQLESKKAMEKVDASIQRTNQLLNKTID